LTFVIITLSSTKTHSSREGTCTTRTFVGKARE
jgi:hypothetical protein